MTVMTNVVLVLKDSEGNIGIVKPLTDNDIIKIANAITDVGQVVDPATHMPIEATTASVGVVQLATAQDIKDGTANKVVDAKELINFAQTLPAANGITDVSSGDNSNQLVVSKIGGNKTLTIDNVEHAGNADEATHATQADTATSANSAGNADTVDGSHAWQMQTLAADGSIHGSGAWLLQCQHNVDGDDYFKLYCGDKSHGTKVDRANNSSWADSAGSVAWDNVSGKPTAVSQFTNDSGYITTDGAAYPRRVGGVTMNFNWSGQGGQPTWLWGGEDGTNMYVYNPANFSVNYANSTGYVQGNNNSANAANALLRSGSGRTDLSPEGDTWIFLDELGGPDLPWGFKHNQAANTIGFYGAGTETSSINLSNGYFSGSCNYANSAGNADTVDGSHAWQMQTLAADGNIHGAGAWLLHCQHNVDGDNYFKLYCGDKSIGTKVDRANTAGWADTSGRVRTQSNTDWYMNCNWDGSYFQTDCISDGGSRLPINVQKANYADSAGSVAWGNVSGRPDIWIG